MEMYRPRIYYTTDSELTAWEELITKIREIGVLSFSDMLSNPKTGTITTEESANSLNIEITNTSIKSKEDLIKACSIDTDQWEVSSFRVSTWQQKENGQQLYAVKCNLTRVTHDTLKQFLTRLEKGLLGSVESEITHQQPTTTDIAIINIYDAHLDKVTRLTETESETDIYKKCETFHKAVDYLISRIGSPKQIIFPVGNDLFNVNDSRNTTKKGTPQETYINHIDAFEIGLNLIRTCINKLANIAPVYVPIIAGNHAEDLEHILGVSLKVLYSENPHIEIDASRLSRKYYKYGENLFMFQHGDKMKSKIRDIPAIMAQEKPQLWAETKQRYAIFGDIHHEQTHDLTGVKAMFLRSMSKLDKWHHQEGYVSCKNTAYAHVFSECGNIFDTFTINFS